MSKKYSLKKLFEESNFSNNKENGLLNEGFWTDLAIAVASSDKGSRSEVVKQMISKKLSAFVEKSKTAEVNKTLDMIKRFKKLGLNNMWGENLDEMEKELTIRARDKNKNNDKIDLKKFMKALNLDVEENGNTPQKKSNMFEGISIPTLKKIFFSS